jgi:hypothetical protein
MRRLGAVVVASLSAVTGNAIAGGSAVADTTTRAFTYTGTEQSFVVPADVCSVTVSAFGAGGGANESTKGLGGSLPGAGGEVEATIDVFPGETLTVVVGGKGGAGTNGVGPGAGGFNGGGAGGSGDNPGSGGGGASDVRRGTERVVVAGGGGGAGNSGEPGEANGGNGGPTGTDGTGNLDGESNSTGGGGAAVDQPGAAGRNSDGTTTAEPGGAGQGGAGGSGGQSGGAGGGGGLLGGGGGGLALPNSGASAGGGGGSSFATAGDATFTPGVRDGDGAVSISYEPSSTPCARGPACHCAALPPPPVDAPPRFTG